MEMQCGENVFELVDNTVLSNENDSSNDFFESLLQPNNILTESPTKNSVSSLEADPLLSEAQLVDGHNILDGFELRFPQQYSPKLSPLVEPPTFSNPMTPENSNISAEETFSPPKPKIKEFPLQILDPSEVIEIIDACNINNNNIAQDGLQSNENENNVYTGDANNTEASGDNSEPKALSEILNPVDNLSDANMNLFRLNSDGSHDIANNTCDILLRNPPNIVEIVYGANTATLIFRNAEGAQVLSTQHMKLPENYNRPKKQQHVVHKIICLSQILVCKQLEYSMPQIHTNLGARIYLCPLKCIRAYLHIADAKLHALKHMQIKPYKCDQPNCSWEFYTACKLARHRETHGKVKNFVCETCNRTFSTIYNLNEHKRKHNKPATLKCPVKGCNAMFQNEKQRRTHCHKTHNHAEAPFRCNLNRCTKSFFTEALLEAHVRTCSLRESEVACSFPNCGKIFNTPYRLREHVRQHTGVRPYHCQFENCTWRFTTASKLKRHQSSHTRDRKFHCTMGGCKKSFLRSEHLKDHTLTHIEKTVIENEGKLGTAANIKKANPEKKVECTKVQPEEEDISLSGTSADSLLEQAIQSLGSDVMMGNGLVPDDSLQLFEDENFSTVNLRDLD